MAYCTQANIEARYSPQDLIKLTDDHKNGAVGTSILNAAIADSDAKIDARLLGKFPTIPFVVIPSLITRISVDFTMYFLYARRLIEIPEFIDKWYKEALDLLKDIAAGKIDLGVDGSDANTGGSVKTNKTTEDRVFTSTILAKM